MALKAMRAWIETLRNRWLRRRRSALSGIIERAQGDSVVVSWPDKSETIVPIQDIKEIFGYSRRIGFWDSATLEVHFSDGRFAIVSDYWPEFWPQFDKVNQMLERSLPDFRKTWKWEVLDPPDSGRVVLVYKRGMRSDSSDSGKSAGGRSE
jgi:hypothetical protein